MNEITDDEARAVTPFDLLNSNNYTDKTTRDERLEVCRLCPEIISAVKVCKKCGCNMPIKTWLSGATCPLGKWGAKPVTTKEVKTP